MDKPLHVNSRFNIHFKLLITFTSSFSSLHDVIKIISQQHFHELISHLLFRWAIFAVFHSKSFRVTTSNQSLTSHITLIITHHDFRIRIHVNQSHKLSITHIITKSAFMFEIAISHSRQSHQPCTSITSIASQHHTVASQHHTAGRIQKVQASVQNDR